MTFFASGRLRAAGRPLYEKPTYREQSPALAGNIHDVFPDGLADRGIEELFFNRRMNLEFRQRLLYDLLLGRSTLGFLESVKQILDRIVILFQEGESGVRC